jgi:hypothetical protein
MDNLITILAVGGLGILAAVVAAVLSSDRIRAKGLGRTLWHNVTSADRNLYRG